MLCFATELPSLRAQLATLASAAPDRDPGLLDASPADTRLPSRRRTMDEFKLEAIEIAD